MAFAFMSGWAHGTSDRRRDMEKYSHDRMLSSQYVKGHAEGRKARHAMELAIEASLEAMEAAAPRRSC